jgi:hypothetical protein
MLLTVTDPQGQVLRRLLGPAKSGFQRVTWDFRWADHAPASLTPRERR